MKEPQWLARIRTAKERVERMVEILEQKKDYFERVKFDTNEDKEFFIKLESARKKLEELEIKYKKGLSNYKEWLMKQDFK